MFKDVIGSGLLRAFFLPFFEEMFLSSTIMAAASRTVSHIDRSMVELQRHWRTTVKGGFKPRNIRSKSLSSTNFVRQVSITV